MTYELVKLAAVNRGRVIGYGSGTPTAPLERLTCPTWRGGGAFRAWSDRNLFEAVHLPPYRAVSWPGELDLCADMLYMRLTGKAVEELFPDLRDAYTNT